MKYLKYFEKNIQFACSIDIRNIGPRKVHLICKKLMGWFTNFRFNSDVELVADTDPKYLKLNTKDYGYIEVSRIYVYFVEEKHYEREHDKRTPIIDPEIVFMSENLEEFIQNVETYEKTEKFNI